MTKTLTEQWREGTLPRGAYYVNRLGEVRIYLVTYENEKNTHEIYEILAPVLSYEEYQTLIADQLSNDEGVEINAELEHKVEVLEKQLAIATKALEDTQEKLLHVELSGLDYDNRHKMYDLMFTDGVIDKALKEIEEVK